MNERIYLTYAKVAIATLAIIVLLAPYVCNAVVLIPDSDSENKLVKPGEKAFFNYSVESFLYPDSSEQNVTYDVIVIANATGGRDWNWSVTPNSFELRPTVMPLNNKTVIVSIIAPPVTDRSSISLTIKFIISPRNSTAEHVSVVEKTVRVSTNVQQLDTFLSEIEFLIRFLVALGIGAMIGIEREHHSDDRVVVAGVRTFPLVAICGMALTYVSTVAGMPYLIHIGIGVFGAFGIAFFFIRHTMNLTGLTSPIAFFVTFVIGLLVGMGMLLEGVICGVATTALLLTKKRLHSAASTLTESEMLGALQFITIAFILFPLMPAQPIDQYNIFNLQSILLIVIIVSSISFISFLVMRYVGAEKGLAFSGLLGGMVNTQAATVSLSNIASKDSKLTNIAIMGIVLANSTMLLRNVVIAAFIEPTMLVAKGMAVPNAIMAAVGVIYTVATHEKKKLDAVKLEIESPFAIKPALKFALYFAGISLLSFVLKFAFGEYGVYFSMIGGLVSSSAVTAAMCTMVFTGQVDPIVGAQTAVGSCIVNSLTLLLWAWTENKPLAQKSILPLAACSAVGGIAMIIMGFVGI